MKPHFEHTYPSGAKAQAWNDGAWKAIHPDGSTFTTSTHQVPGKDLKEAQERALRAAKLLDQRPE